MDFSLTATRSDAAGRAPPSSSEGVRTLIESPTSPPAEAGLRSLPHRRPTSIAHAGDGGGGGDCTLSVRSDDGVDGGVQTAGPSVAGPPGHQVPGLRRSRAPPGRYRGG